MVAARLCYGTYGRDHFRQIHNLFMWPLPSPPPPQSVNKHRNGREWCNRNGNNSWNECICFSFSSSQIPWRLVTQCAEQLTIDIQNWTFEKSSNEPFSHFHSSIRFSFAKICHYDFLCAFIFGHRVCVCGLTAKPQQVNIHIHKDIRRQSEDVHCPNTTF